MRIDYTPEEIAEAIAVAPLLVAYQEQFNAAFEAHTARIEAEEAKRKEAHEKAKPYEPFEERGNVVVDAMNAAHKEVGPSPYPQWYQRPAVFVVALASLLTPDGQKETS